MDPYHDPQLRHGLHAALNHAQELRALLAGCEGDADAETARAYADELARVERWIDGWPDSAMVRDRVEG